MYYTSFLMNHWTYNDLKTFDDVAIFSWFEIFDPFGWTNSKQIKQTLYIEGFCLVLFLLISFHAKNVFVHFVIIIRNPSACIYVYVYLYIPFNVCLPLSNCINTFVTTALHTIDLISLEHQGCLKNCAKNYQWFKNANFHRATQKTEYILSMKTIRLTGYSTACIVFVFLTKISFNSEIVIGKIQ